MRGGAAPGAALERPPAGANLIEAKGLRKEFRLRTGWFASKALVAVREVSFGITRGRTVGLVGESGSGKTTVALLVMRLLEASGGEARLEDTDLLRLSPAQMMAVRRRSPIVFQNPYASLNPRMSIGRTLTEPMRIHRLGAAQGERIERARGLLQGGGLPQDAMERDPHEFSGGRRQRIAMAPAAAVQPDGVYV